MLDRLVSRRADELERLAAGQKIDMIASAFICWLVTKEAKEQEIAPSSLESPEPGPVAPWPAPKALKAAPSKAPTSNTSAPQDQPSKGRGR